MGGRIFAVGFLAFSIVCSTAAYGDGGVFFAMTSKRLSGQVPAQSAQQAALFWSDGTESLHLRSNYTGPRADFAWVIPVPARPRVTQSTWAAFETAEKATRPSIIVHHAEKSGGGPGCSTSSTSESNTQLQSKGVVVLERLEVKEFHVDILSAKEGAGLIQWLQENAYAVPEKAAGILDEYIRAGFYFVAVKVRQEELPKHFASRRRSVQAGLTPLAISFECPKPFFPLKISSISSAAENELLILVVTDEPVKPNEYPFVHLTQDDIYAAFKAGGYRVPDSADVDFEPAIRIAQGRSEAPALVLEARHDDLSPVHTELDAIRKTGTARGCWVSRFHAFLRPQDMKDITFSMTPGGEMRGVFLVELQSEHKSPALGLAPICLIALGAAGMALSLASRAGTRARFFSILLLFLAACMI